jgi:hypothetical protein
MTGTGRGHEAKYNKVDFLISDILGKDNFSVEDLNSDNCFQAEETVVDQQQALLCTSILLADTPSPSSVRDEIGICTLALVTCLCMSHIE